MKDLEQPIIPPALTKKGANFNNNMIKSRIFENLVMANEKANLTSTFENKNNFLFVYPGTLMPDRTLNVHR